jgi:hypothetical protein
VGEVGLVSGVGQGWVWRVGLGCGTAMWLACGAWMRLAVNSNKAVDLVPDWELTWE